MGPYRLVLVTLAVATVVLPVTSIARTEAAGAATEINATLLQPLKSLYRAVAEAQPTRPEADADIQLVQKIEFGRVRWVELRSTATGTVSTDTRRNPRFRFGEDAPPPLTVLENGNWRARFPGSASSIISLR